MKEFQGKVAVVTGAASGIGRALAERCAQEGMRVVLAGINEQTLLQACQELKAEGASVLAVQTDVSKAGDVEALAQKAFDTYGAVHLLFNNAGVGAGTMIWESTLADWEWTIGVNLWGVIHGIRAFVPRMLEQDTEGHIVNTASIAGLTSGPGLGIYKVTKYGVVTLSETLYHELALRGAKIKTSVLCPGFVKTRIMDGARNRPARLQNDPAEVKMGPESVALIQFMLQAVEAGMPPQQVADIVFQAIRDETFYILTHPESKEEIRVRMEDMLQERNPTFIPVLP
ncbi:MAG TPA: SDR family NAD(P)-dependent oxidoreductase [Ktedonobacteraceae bacterium]|nr:SDR family NAD(P)-dependent oxidoreductase [Ktedonobacteraceae bacterium]